ncbi:MAG: aspartate aminotransferase family protein [Desulfurococcaceae archaeon]
MNPFEELHFPNAPYIAVEPPGPKARELLNLQKELESSAVLYPPDLPFVPEEAKGATIKDVDGNIYIDLFSGISVLNFGHSNPFILERAIEQMKKLTHTLDFPTYAREELARKLVNIAPGGMRNNSKVLFGGPTGSDAIEGAIKLAKYITKRHAIIAFENSYHGQTTAALSVTSNRKYKDLYGPLGPEVHFVPYPYCYRCPLKLEYSECEMRCFTYLEHVVEYPYSGLPKPAAILIEPVQGEGGVIVPPPGFLKRVEKLARENGILLIIDEIQSGMGRTGTWFACEHEEVTPDIVTMAKSLGGIGLPLAGIIYKKELEPWVPGGHIGTFRGNVVAMAAGAAAIEFAEKTNLLEHVRRMGEDALRYLKDFAQESKSVGEVRGKGLIIGIELVEDKVTKKPATEMAKKVQLMCFKRGILLWKAGAYANVIRLLPPLVITKELLERGLEVLTGVIRELESAK